MSVLEKLLVPAVAQRIVDQGYDELSGAVYRAEDLLGLPPAQRIAALRLDGPDGPFGTEVPDHVDVVRFTTNPLMELRVSTPVAGAPELPWPTHPLGFLANAAPVWWLTMTRMPVSARYIRVGSDGTEREFSRYLGAAHGWRGAKGYFPPLHLVGPRVKFRGMEFPASYTADQQSLELVWVGDQQVPEGFVQTRPRTHARVVPVAECDDIFEIVLTATWRGVPVRILQSAGPEVLLVLTLPTPESVAFLGATEMEPGLFQVTAPAAELRDTRGIRLEPRQ